MKINVFKYFLILVVLFAGLTACGSNTGNSVGEETVTRGFTGKKGSDDTGEKDKISVGSTRPVEVYKGELDTVIMIYMVGSNLESQNGLGSADIHEISNAISNAGVNDPKVKIIIQTGGAKQWSKDYGISPDKLQRYEIEKDELVLKDEFDMENMARPETLAEFMQWGFKAYPADRYGLILWDHGGGSVMGYGADENFQGSMMRLNQLQKAFEAVDAHFAFIGFDACLMATLETARMLVPYSDYLIASEEMEPGNGWDYTNWVAELIKEPDIPVEDIGKRIIDDFASENEKEGNLYTLSLIDLKQIDKVYTQMLDFLKDFKVSLENKQFDRLSKARNDARSFGNGNYEQVDIIDLSDKADYGNKETLSGTVNDAVLYFKTNMKYANGLAMYYPCQFPDQYARMYSLLEKLEYDREYRDFLSGFCTVMTGTDPDSEGGEDFSAEEWYDTELARLYSKEVQPEFKEAVPYLETEDGYVVDITPEQMEKMVFCGMEVWLDDGNGYIELGIDSWSETTQEGYISAYFDNIWMTINDNLVPFYMQDMGMMTDETAYEYGYVPALLNDDVYVWIRVELLQPETGNGSASICGYWVYDDMEFEGGDSVRNLKQFKEGDRIAFVTTIHDYEDEVGEICQLGDPITVSKDGLRVGYSVIEDAKAYIRYSMEDVYGNIYYTDWMEGQTM
ncbi:MAG: hypothetical protein K6E98_01315 [Lachnospiraceae bacterium]|nr:hypothetical protein [Lachnospiraceae bacterium]